MFSSNTSQVSQDQVFIEDVFSTYLYTGNSSTQTITNGIDLSGKGGLVWSKDRTQADNNRLYDTARGTNNVLFSNSTSAALTDSNTVTAFNSNGYSIGSSGNVNFNGDNFVSWTFRKQPKFFDVVTWTATGSTQTINHNLGSVPGTIIVKKTSGTSSWFVYHRSLGENAAIFLNNTNPADTGVPNYWNGTAPTSTQFTVGDYISASGATYVAYLFAHNAGGFGLSGSDNVITCGSYTGNGTTQTIELGYEPQWVLIKQTNTARNWVIQDNMRGMSYTNDANLKPNTSDAEEVAGEPIVRPTATGFNLANNFITWNQSGGTYIYIAIRRGPMKTPTSGTSVFSPNAVADDSSAITTNFPVDGYWEAVRTGNLNNFVQQSRLTGGGQFLITSSTAAQDNTGFTTVFQNNTGYTPGTFGSSSIISYAYRRAPGFFDVVCYSGTSAARTVSHNLGVAPELMIVKARSGSLAGNIDWFVYAAPLGNSSRLLLNTTGASADGQTVWNNTTPTSSVFSLGTSDNINGSGYTYVNYLFASCPGVSKVGSYTGTGTTKQIDCGFTSGARFVLIKRTDSTGDWYVWDSARGIVAGNDPYLLLNSTAAEVTNTDYIDTYSAGFEISSTAPAAINANGGSFVFLAIA